MPGTVLISLSGDFIESPSLLPGQFYSWRDKGMETSLTRDHTASRRWCTGSNREENKVVGIGEVSSASWRRL